MLESIQQIPISETDNSKYLYRYMLESIKKILLANYFNNPLETSGFNFETLTLYTAPENWGYMLYVVLA